jgi:AmiR/NasT family two-component response regulator
MKVKGMSEDAAYCFIRDEAKRRNCKTEDYARIIVENQK